jgi:transcriptional regulator with XRE-family HTH domain
MEWSSYVRQVIGADKQVDVSRKTGVDQTTISRWLNPERGAARISSQSVAAFARGYGRPVLEAFVVAGFLTAEEAGVVPTELPTTLQIVPSDELVAELNRRLSS